MLRNISLQNHILHNYDFQFQTRGKARFVEQIVLWKNIGIQKTVSAF